MKKILVALTLVSGLFLTGCSQSNEAATVGDYYDILIQTAGHDLNVQTGSSFSVQRIQA